MVKRYFEEHPKRSMARTFICTRSASSFAAAFALSLLLALPAAAAGGITVEVQDGYRCDYGVDIPFTPSPRASSYTFALYPGSTAAGTPQVTAKVTTTGSTQTSVHLPLQYDVSGPSTWTLCVTAAPEPGRIGLDRAETVRKTFELPPSCGCPVGTAGAFYAGDGSAASPYRVASQRQLAHVEKHPSSCCRQEKDIALSGSWTPISAFQGTYDGDGHVIKNLQIDVPGTAGLFESTDGATICRLGIAANSHVRGGRVAGSIIGNANETIIRQCYSLAVVQTDAYNSACGGLIGTGSHTDQISDSFFAGTLDNTRAYDGAFMSGLIAFGSNTSPGKPTTITNCYSAADYQFYYVGTTHGLGSLAGGLALWTPSGWATGNISSQNNYWLTGTYGCPDYAVGDFCNGAGKDPASPGAAKVSSFSVLPAGFDESIWRVGSYRRPTYDGGWETVSAPVLKVFEENP